MTEIWRERERERRKRKKEKWTNKNDDGTLHI
jgi:hypothetical protein